MTKPEVIVFADECGIPVVIAALKNIAEITVIYDPDRSKAVECCKITYPKIKSLPHPAENDYSKFLKNLKDKSPKLGVIMSYSRILKEDMISLFENGVINIHNGKLPQYRGANTLQWSIINGEEETAVTMHYVDKGIDTGPIIAEALVKINASNTALVLRDKMIKESEVLLKKWIPQLLENKLDAKPQNESNVSYWPRRKPEDGLIDWKWSNKRIHDLTRALVSPWPPAFYLDINNQKVEIKGLMSVEDISDLRRNLGK